MKPAKRERTRKANFSPYELQTLIEEAAKERDVILGLCETTHSRSSHQRKKEVWNKIAFKINAMFGTDRREIELRTKWKELKLAAKRRMYGLTTRPVKKQATTTVNKESALELIKQVVDIIEAPASKLNSSSDETLTITIGNPVGSYSAHLDSELVTTENDVCIEEIAEGECFAVSHAAENPGMPSGCEISENPRMPTRSEILENPGMPTRSGISENPGIPTGSEFSETPRLFIGSEILVNHPNSTQVTVDQTKSIHSYSQSCQPSFAGSSSNNAESHDQPQRIQSNEIYMESLQERKLKLEIKWLESEVAKNNSEVAKNNSEVAKNDSIVEMTNAKADYIRAKKAKLEK